MISVNTILCSPQNWHLVGGAITILKNISQWEGLSHYPIYKMENKIHV
jgi:hypothetical protein